jgi:ABC-type Fe3+ transport system permease subunit
LQRPYIAEDVRGGLQAIPPTQREAAMVLGLSPRQTLQLVVLPQAFRVALPSLTNQAVGLLQNTSLMAILGLVELLGNQPQPVGESRIHRSLSRGVHLAGCGLLAGVHGDGLCWPVTLKSSSTPSVLPDDDCYSCH